MDAGNQGSTQETQAAPAEAAAKEGPREIFVHGQASPESEAPKEKPAPAKQPESKAAGSEEDPEGSGKGNRDEKGRFKGGVQDRIDELTRARREAEREAEYWRQRAKGGDQSAQQAAKDPSARPQREQFQSDADFTEALTDWKVEQKLSQREQQQKQVAENTKKADSWSEKLSKARGEVENYDEVLANADMPVAGHVAELIMEHDHGAKIIHHLAQNPEIVEKLNDMSPAKAATELARIGVQFDAPPTPAASSKPAPQASVSKAPPPPSRPVGQGRSTAPAMGDMSMDEYIAARKAQGANWAQRH